MRRSTPIHERSHKFIDDMKKLDEGTLDSRKVELDKLDECLSRSLSKLALGLFYVTFLVGGICLFDFASLSCLKYVEYVIWAVISSQPFLYRGQKDNRTKMFVKIVWLHQILYRNGFIIT